MSLLGGEGLETAASKAARGAKALPLERFFRDARIYQTAGGVNFMIDYIAALSLLGDLFYPEPANIDKIESPTSGDAKLVAPYLTQRNTDHLCEIRRQSVVLSRHCLKLSREHPEIEALLSSEQKLILISQISSELFTSLTTLARSSHLASKGNNNTQDLADIYCTQSSYRLAALWAEAGETDGSAYSRVSENWLTRDGLGFMLKDVITQIPPI